MNKLFLAISATLLLALSGCGNLSPRLDQEIDNQNGRIDNLETIQNGMKNEIGKQDQRNEIQDSKIGQMQQGFANWQSNYQNSGVQILSGPGGLVFAIFAMLSVGVMIVIVFHYKNEAARQGKVANILAQQIVDMNDDELVDHVFMAAMHTDIEETMLRVFEKHQK